MPKSFIGINLNIPKSSLFILKIHVQVGFYLQTTKFSLKLEIKSNTPKTYAISHKTLLFVSNFKENYTLWEQEFSLKFETLQAIHLKPTRLVIKHCFFTQSLKRTLSFVDRNPPVLYIAPTSKNYISFDYKFFFCDPETTKIGEPVTPP